MPRKEKQYIQAMEDEPKLMSGGTICHICAREIDGCCEEMKGSGYLSKASEKVEKVSRKGASKVKKASKATAKYVTDVEGLSSDLVNYGIPAASSATLGALGSATGNPLIGVAASALGAKLGTMAADKIANETAIQSRYEGEGLKPKRKAKFEKGSQAAKDHMAELRAKRKPKV